MNNAIELTNEITDSVMPEVNVITQAITNNQAANNDEVIIGGQLITLEGIPDTFEVREGGIYSYVGQGEDELNDAINISDTCLIAGYVEYQNHNTLDRQVVFKNLFGDWRTISIPMAETSGNPKRLAQILTSHGLYIDEKQLQKFYEYFIGCKPTTRFVCVYNPGWIGKEYAISECPDAMPVNKYIHRAPNLSKNQFKTSGTLIEWKTNVAAKCINNSRLAMAIMVAFGSILMPLLGGKSCGFHYSSPSSRGKTTALKIGKSVVGSPLDLASWRTTDNALEAIAAEHNHSLLCLDEFGQMTESGLKKTGDTIYMLGNEEGKSRYKMSEELKTWQLYYLSSGELSLRDTFLRGKKTLMVGQEVRFVDISADTGSGHGIFDTVHDFADGAAFADELNRNVELYHGTAGRAFIKELTENMDEWLEIAHELKRDFLSSIDLSETSPQVRRVADHFAIIVAAGELASQLGITGWADGQAVWAGEECFKSWLDMCSGAGSQEEMAINTVQSKLLQYGHSKFITAENPTPRGQYWGKREGNNYFIFTEVFNNQICVGLNAKQAIIDLKESGYIIPSNDGRNSILKRIDGKVIRCIHIHESLFAGETQDSN